MAKAKEKTEKKAKYNSKKAILFPAGRIWVPTREELKEFKAEGSLGLAGGPLLFDSIKEAEYYRDVLLPAYARGDIRSIAVQPKFELLPKFTSSHGIKHQAITYSPDFLVEYMDGRRRAIDVKGMMNDRFAIKRKLYDNLYPDKPLLAVKHVLKFGGWVTLEEYANLKRIEKKAAKTVAKGS